MQGNASTVVGMQAWHAHAAELACEGVQVQSACIQGAPLQHNGPQTKQLRASPLL